MLVTSVILYNENMIHYSASLEGPPIFHLGSIGLGSVTAFDVLGK